jgi:hypothetical protein
MSGCKCIAKEEASAFEMRTMAGVQSFLRYVSEEVFVCGTQTKSELIHPHTPKSKFALFASIRG